MRWRRDRRPRRDALGLGPAAGAHTARHGTARHGTARGGSGHGVVRKRGARPAVTWRRARRPLAAGPLCASYAAAASPGGTITITRHEPGAFLPRADGRLARDERSAGGLGGLLWPPLPPDVCHW